MDEEYLSRCVTLSTTSIISLVFLLLVPSLCLVVLADSTNPGVFGNESRPYNSTYGEWTAKWWQWLLSIPQDSSPAVDETGEHCGTNQNGPVWFLAGTTGGSAERTCIVPSGKAILFPVINSMCDYASYPTVRTESELLACARADNDQAINLQASVDGTNLKSLEEYRIESPLSNITFPENNIFGVVSGSTEMISDGFWVFLEPLQPGEHEIRFSGETASNPTLGINSFATEVTYHINIRD